MRTLVIGALCLTLCLAAVGCGRGASTAADTAPFERAITTYLAEHSMGMKVAGFESLEVQGETATARCRMQVADDVYGGVAVRWDFTFRRGQDGSWKVESLDRG